MLFLLLLLIPLAVGVALSQTDSASSDDTTTDDDQIKASRDDDTLTSGPGDDVVRARAGDDRVWAGSGDDTVRGGDGDDYIVGGEGDDVLRGGRDDDEIHGNGGDDRLFGGYGINQLFGEEGNDELHGSGDGGPGDDVLYLKGDTGNGANGDDVCVSVGQHSHRWRRRGSVSRDGRRFLRPQFHGDHRFRSGHRQFGNPRGCHRTVGGLGGWTRSVHEETSLWDVREEDGGLILSCLYYDDPGWKCFLDRIFLAGLDFADWDHLRGFDGIGTPDADHLENTPATPNLFGVTGDDHLYGLFGAGTLDGGAGDDLLYSDGDDTMLGGSGSDDFLIEFDPLQSTGDFTVEDFDPATDTLVLTVATRVEGVADIALVDRGDGSGTDVIYDGASIGFIQAPGGLDPDDIQMDLNIEDHHTTAILGTGFDLVLFEDQFMTIEGSDDGDTIKIGGNYGVWIYSNGSNDEITIERGGYRIDTRYGDEYEYYRPTQNVTVSAGDGDDRVDISSGGTVSLGDGADTLHLGQLVLDAGATFDEGDDLTQLDDDRPILDFEPSVDVIEVEVNPSEMRLFALVDDSALIVARQNVDAESYRVWEGGARVEVVPEYIYYATLEGLGAADAANVSILRG